MNRLYLQDAFPAATLGLVKEWGEQLDADGLGTDATYVVVDGGIAGDAGRQRLRDAYGVATQSFDDTVLADYEELGLLVWPWRTLHAKDALETLRITLAGKPGVSFVQSRAGLPAVCAALAWLGAAETEDGMLLYLRIGDTRVLSSFLFQLQPAQEARLHAAVSHWAWPDRSGGLKRAATEAMPHVQPAEGSLVLDNAQYAALLDAVEADMLHASVRAIEAKWIDARSGNELHQWLQALLPRMRGLGITRPKDKWAFVSLALRAPDGFEGLTELGQTWLRVRSGASELNAEISQWKPGVEWQAMQRLANANAAAAVAPPKGSR